MQDDTELMEEALDLEEDRLTSWERTFIEDMEEWVFTKEKALSVTQREKLEQIISQRQ